MGGGSIGARHLKNLTALGVGDLALVEPDETRRLEVSQALGIAGFAGLAEGLAWRPEFVVIATPNHLHVEQALAAARHNCHLFVEKPLSHSSKCLVELAGEIERQSLVSLVGCNMRFHPGPARVKELLDQGAIGRLLFARVYTGSYLPEWRPWQDYRRSYSANGAMGGGCLLDCIHEIDLSRWYAGEIQEVFCLAGHFSSLEVDTEDVAAMVCKHENGAVSEIHLDYVQRTYDRGCQVAGEEGSIFWDFGQGTVRWFDAQPGVWHTFDQPGEWVVNDMYLDEMRHFLQCVSEGRTTVLTVAEAVKVMQVVFAARASAASGRLVSVRQVLT
ncbi:MAG: Gfo/Idh/MocA family oxidoreductase [Chloroflexi bacterium]|nr:Gfo/Idh/MocA family oxidoreductase [Chloroflexota bacterium]